MTLLAERLWLASPLELAEAHGHLLRRAPHPDEGRVLIATRIKQTIETLFSPEVQRYRVARRVAGLVARRWADAGVIRWTRDTAGRPIPHAEGAVHRYQFSYRLSPSGKALFACRGCAMRPMPTEGKPGRCPGMLLDFDAVHFLALAVYGGADYQPDARGLLVPHAAPEQASACSCCWCVGPWTHRDPVVKQLVCPACARDAAALMRLGAREVRTAVHGREPWTATR
jgi:hypothetical protein